MRQRTTTLIAAVTCALALAGCRDDDGTATSTEAGDATPVAAPVVTAGCDAAREAVTNYGPASEMASAAELTGSEVATWSSTRMGVSDGIAQPVVRPEDLGLSPDEEVEVCVFRGTFDNAAPPKPSQAEDLGVVTEIGMLVNADGSVQISYMKPERAHSVSPPADAG